jgi:hypothetical protein
MAKTFYLEQHGIRVDGCHNKTEARKAWEAARDEFVERAADGPWIFATHGHTVVVTAEPCANCWSYTIVRPDDSGRRWHSCSFTASSQIAAIAVAIGSLAQNVWTSDIPDDGAFFDALVVAARLTAQEARNERANYVTVTAHWRSHPIAAAA